jgi:hypothetical protein
MRTLGGLLALAFVLFMLSGIPRYKNAKSWGWDLFIGDIFWFGFLICALLFIVGGVYTIVRSVRGRRMA